MKAYKIGGNDPFIKAAKDSTSIGNLAVAKGWISKEDLEKALLVQREKLRLGEIFVDLKLLTEEQRDELLFEQRRRRGYKIPIEELRAFEREKLQRRLEGLKAGFREASKHAKNFACEIHSLTGDTIGDPE